MLAGFVVDFYCPTLRLAIEVDGDVHLQRCPYDEDRDRILVRLGVEILRVRNEEVDSNVDALALMVRRRCASRAESLSLSPELGGKGRG